MKNNFHVLYYKDAYNIIHNSSRIKVTKSACRKLIKSTAGKLNDIILRKKLSNHSTNLQFRKLFRTFWSVCSFMATLLTNWVTRVITSYKQTSSLMSFSLNCTNFKAQLNTANICVSNTQPLCEQRVSAKAHITFIHIRANARARACVRVCVYAITYMQYAFAWASGSSRARDRRQSEATSRFKLLTGAARRDATVQFAWCSAP